MRHIKDKIDVAFGLLNKALMKETIVLNGFQYAKDGYCSTNSPSEDIEWMDYNGEILPELDAHYWFKGKIKIPSQAENTITRLRLRTGHDLYDPSCRPQLMMFIEGHPTYVFDTAHHTCSVPEGEYDVLVNYYTVPALNEFVHYITEKSIFQAQIETVWANVEKVINDFDILIKTLEMLQENTAEHTEILKVLDHACNLLDFRKIGSPEFLASVDTASGVLDEFFKKFEENPKSEVLELIGHSHLDVAWLWRVCQGYEKAQRTLSNAVLLFEKYPEFKFMFTQPALLEKVKAKDPELFRKLQKYAKEGRFVVDGAMWVEPDTNLPSGESLVRQTVWGKRFIKENFDTDSTCLWLPDVFGYSVSLPQILKKSGVDKFYTTKIAWNDTNKFPHTFFKWEGLDGTDIWAFLLHTHLGTIMAPRYEIPVFNNQKNKSHISSTLTTFGYGDGGGGPTENMMEVYKRAKNGLPGHPALKISTPKDFFERKIKEFEEASERLRDEPRWVGELYLEFHRGTLTSVAAIKKFNRLAEFLCHNVELAGATASVLLGASYPEKVLDEMWHTVLVNQFHDIIPGSSIKEVYDDARVEFADFFEKGHKTLSSCVDTLLSNVKTSAKSLIYNPNPFAVSGVVELDGKNVYVENIAPLGWSPANATNPQSVISENGILENDILRISFNEKGEMVSVVDKRTSREIVKEGKKVNDLVFYEDRPKLYEAWETSCYYTQKSWGIESVESMEHFVNGAVGGVRIKSRFMDSTITQEITLAHNSARVDFKTHVDWQQDHIMLRAHFPTVIRSDNATYETQFGHISRPTHRNTSWDEAKFEVCAHKWADLSEYGCGIAILNNCKYGYSALGGDLSITLLKSPGSPYADADRGEHEFTYSLFVHNGDFKGSGVIEEATLLNNPLICKAVNGSGALPETYSFATSSNPATVIDCIKQADDGSGTVLRIYESHNSKATTTVSLGFDVSKAYVCDTLENELYEIPVTNNSVMLEFSNFEFTTIKLK